MKPMNKVFENTSEQIKSTTEILRSSGFVTFDNPPERNITPKRQQLTWSNSVSGRSVSGKAFLTIDQYLTILSANSYQLLLQDYSIVRYSFVFDGAHLIQQNLLWWPCPVKMDEDIENEFGLIQGIKQKINSSNNQSDYIMRSPIRIDFDSTKDTSSHPRAHTHFEHADCRVNSIEPICFNRFMRFIIENFYPESKILCNKWNYLTYQYQDRYKKATYDNHTTLVI